MMPFEAWNEEKPLVDHLHVLVVMHVHMLQKMKGKKLDSKSRKCILLGYRETTKGYLLYDLSRSKVIFSRGVRLMKTYLKFHIIL